VDYKECEGRGNKSEALSPRTPRGPAEPLRAERRSIHGSKLRGRRKRFESLNEVQAKGRRTNQSGYKRHLSGCLDVLLERETRLPEEGDSDRNTSISRLQMATSDTKNKTERKRGGGEGSRSEKLLYLPVMLGL